MSGPARWLELSLGAELRAARTVCGLLEVALAALDLDPSLRHDVTLAVAEVVTNVVEHEYRVEGAGAGGQVRLRLEVAPDHLRVRVESQGPPFDLAAALRKAAQSDPLADLQGSGLGLILVNALFDEAESAHLPERGNVVTLVKRLAG